MQLLTVSVSEFVVDFVNELLAEEPDIHMGRVYDARDAKRTLVDTDFDLIILDSPLPDGNAIQLAIDLSRSQSFDFSIILLVDANLYEENLYQAERMGIVTFRKPVDPHLLLQTIHLLLSFRAKIQKLENKAGQLEQKLADTRLISKAKLLLVEKRAMSEQNAHYYIEKRAMDQCIKKTKVAKEIIQMYEKNKIR